MHAQSMLKIPSLHLAHHLPLVARHCSRCLGPNHLRKDCTNMVRCKSCFSYGHISSVCLLKARNQQRFRPISREGEGTEKAPIYLSSSPTLEASVYTAPLPTVQNPNLSPPMANWAFNPLPHVPKGFALVEPVPRPPLHHKAYVTGCYTLSNEDLAIVKLQP